MPREVARPQSRKMDLTDLRAKKPLLDKARYISRVKSVIRSAQAQKVAKAFAKKFRSSCQQVVLRKGAAADN